MPCKTALVVVEKHSCFGPICGYDYLEICFLEIRYGRTSLITCYKRTGYNINLVRQSACLVVNTITVINFAALFNCTCSCCPYLYFGSPIM